MNTRLALIFIAICFTLTSCSPASARFPKFVGESPENAKIKPALEKVEPGRLLDTLNSIARPRDPFADSAKVRNNIEDIGGYFQTEFASLGLEVSWFDQLYSYEGRDYSMKSYFGELPGSGPEAAPLIVCAHWDSVGEEMLAVDDNASGCAVLLEAARIVPEYRPVRSFL